MSICDRLRRRKSDSSVSSSLEYGLKMVGRSESSPCGVCVGSRGSCVCCVCDVGDMGDVGNVGYVGYVSDVSMGMSKGLVSLRKSMSESRLHSTRSKITRSLYASQKTGFSLSPFQS